ncbi:unnamed protein product [Rotaria sp. Silwood2]|nr:unnamed protein product [Rotaria sp. Silwood2]CAF2810079.1 unnamed protein product [Rotaria sp. Silwood2]CAF3118474.1 unnamed protein product [Rotaria sp. Silwood2]CAF3209962.1 unnamed protein product [Rotaria sp. Silwood2]CAF3869072.1 unnamed protein product [Rotaria sp. Silwood2]
MDNSSQSRGFQAYNSSNSKTCPPSTRLKSIKSIDESLVFGRIPYSSIRTSSGTVPSLPPSPDGIIKPTPMSPKRRSSTVLLSNLLPRRKSLQTTAIATRRQSLWMSIAKNDSSANDFQLSLLPLRQEHNSLMRKKLLRLLLVFSYLISISLLAIALATFYGFFWTGYSTSKTTTISDLTATVRSLVSLTSNSTFVDYETEIEDSLLMKSTS